MSRSPVSTETLFIIAQDVHSRWLQRNRRKGITTRLSALDNTELMTPWDQLSQVNKESNIEGVEEQFLSLAEAGYVTVPASALDRLCQGIDEIGCELLSLRRSAAHGVSNHK